MLDRSVLLNLPSSNELPSSDDTPVDSELQETIPNLLKWILSYIWSNRSDWFFGIDMGLYHTTGENPRIASVPDGFLCLGVDRLKNHQLRTSYVTWEENYVSPIFVLEHISETYGGEYDQKMEKYAKLGVLYYAIYNPDFWQRNQHQPLEIYRLDNGIYKQELGEPVWLPEIGLGLGRAIGIYEGLQREWLFWFNQEGNRYLSPDEVIVQEQDKVILERNRAELERTQKQRLADKLRELGIDPDAYLN